MLKSATVAAATAEVARMRGLLSILDCCRGAIAASYRLRGRKTIRFSVASASKIAQCPVSKSISTQRKVGFQ